MLVNFTVNEETFTGIITDMEDTNFTVSYIDPQTNQKSSIRLSKQNVIPYVSNTKLIKFYNNLMINFKRGYSKLKNDNDSNDRETSEEITDIEEVGEDNENESNDNDEANSKQFLLQIIYVILLLRVKK